MVLRHWSKFGEFANPSKPCSLTEEIDGRSHNSGTLVIPTGFIMHKSRATPLPSAAHYASRIISPESDLH